MASTPEPTSEALWRVLVDALDPLPDSRLVERDDWVQLRTPSSRHPHHNKILRAVLDGESVHERIAAVMEDHDATGSGFMWVVDAKSRPVDLGRRLDELGIPRHATMLGMVRDTLGNPVSIPDDVRVLRATASDVDVLADIGTRGWQRDTTFGEGIADWARRIFAGTAGDVAFWIAYLRDDPVGSATLRFLPGLGYLQGACVLPQARGRGVYAALTAVRLAELRTRAIAHATIWADENTSAPILARMGFVVIDRADLHERRAPHRDGAA